MTFELPPLPYGMGELEPHISERTLEFHYGKHHQAYVNKLNGLVPGTQYEGQSLEQIIKNADGAIFNNAAQVWNHTFYWHSMSPNGGGEPGDALAKALIKDFGSVEAFKQQFTDSALTRFGSGWAWLVKDDSGKLQVVSTSNAGNPITDDLTPLLTCDVWEHAYYLDTQNNRGQYVTNFWQLVNWDFVAKNFSE